MDIKALAHEVQSQVVAFRRDIHQNPETGLQEFRTTQKVCEELDKLGIPYRKTDPTGVIAEIVGTKGPSDHRVLIRADMDALTIDEETGLPFASTNGLMHACGHDTHTSMLVGAAMVLNQIKDQFAGTARLVFQPAEEIGKGADLMVAQGAAEGVDLGMALHISSDAPTGSLSSTEGPACASADRFVIKVKGRDCHGAQPNAGADSVVAAVAIVMGLQTMVSREFDPMDPIVVTVGSIHAGSRFNVIPGEATLEGTCRSFDHDMWEKIPAVMERVAQNIAVAYKCTAEVTFDRITKPLVGDKAVYELIKGAAQKVVASPDLWIEGSSTMGGEDFASFGEKMPIAMVNLGADGGAPMHSSKVCFHEESFETGVACYAQFVVDALAQLNG